LASSEVKKKREYFVKTKSVSVNTILAEVKLIQSERIKNQFIQIERTQKL
jgi:hypothetical protein